MEQKHFKFVENKVLTQHLCHIIRPADTETQTHFLIKGRSFTQNLLR